MSIGIGDTVADAATGAHIANIIDEAKNKVKGIIEEFQVSLCIPRQQLQYILYLEEVYEIIESTHGCAAGTAWQPSS